MAIGHNLWKTPHLTRWMTQSNETVMVVSATVRRQLMVGVIPWFCGKKRQPLHCVPRIVAICHLVEHANARSDSSMLYIGASTLMTN